VTRDPWDLTDAEVDALLAEPVPLTYWLNPRNWGREVTAWLYQHDWRTYCWQHDVCHWVWTHRKCGCWRTTVEGRAWQERFTRILNRGESTP
jgi:hypothetical protein